MSCQGSVCKCAFAKWNRECACVQVLQNKTACGRSCGPGTQQLPPHPLHKLSRDRQRGSFCEATHSTFNNLACERGGWCGVVAAGKSHLTLTLLGFSKKWSTQQGGLVFKLQQNFVELSSHVNSYIQNLYSSRLKY